MTAEQNKEVFNNQKSFFPLLIVYTDTQEEKVVKSCEQIENNKTFKVLKTCYVQE